MREDTVELTGWEHCLAYIMPLLESSPDNWDLLLPETLERCCQLVLIILGQVN